MSVVDHLVDHLVYATPDLDDTVLEFAERVGVRPSAGGQHPGRGTRNALLALGPGCYLEIVAPDPDQPPPEVPRWFGIDALTAPRLMTWAERATNLTALRDRALRADIDIGEIATGRRQRPDGVTLSWQLTNPRTMLADGLVPFFIDWGDSPHPASTAATGLHLVALKAEHPDPSSVVAPLQALGVDLPVAFGASPALIAIIDGPRGRFELR